jgi:endonuclease G
MTAKNKKPASRPRKSSPTRKTASRSGLRRFLFTTAASALASFQIASCSLDPGWNDRLLHPPRLSTLNIPGLESVRGPAVGNVPPAGNLSTGFSHCRQFFPGGEPPALQPRPRQRELCFSAFAVLHSGETKTPVFVVERLNRAALEQGKGLQRGDKFYADARLPGAERAELDDYRRSGYSRGHMAPAADMSSPEAMAQSFSLANMVPQDQTHNAGAWSKIEQDTRRYALRANGDVYVFTGPVFDGAARTIGPGQVHVPSHLFKLVYDASTGRSWVHWQANSADTRVGPPISYEEFTRRTGMPLLSGVARARG